MSEDLNKLKDNNVTYLQKEGFNVFYGGEVPLAKPMPEIEWSKEGGNWKNFVKSAKLEGVKTIVIDYSILTKDDIEINLETEEIENAKTVNEKLQALKDFVGKIGELNLMWIQDGVKYTYRETSDWWLDFVSLVAQRREIELVPSTEEERMMPRMIGVASSQIPEDLKAKTAEELAEEIGEFIKKEFPDAEPFSFHELTRLFWTRKGLRFGYVEDPEITLKMRKAETLVKQKLEREQLKKEKKLLPELVKECVKWAKDNGFKKMTKMNVGVFLAEKGVTLSPTNRDILYGRVNIILKKEG